MLPLELPYFLQIFLSIIFVRDALVHTLTVPSGYLGTILLLPSDPSRLAILLWH